MNEKNIYLNFEHAWICHQEWSCNNRSSKYSVVYELPKVDWQPFLVKLMCRLLYHWNCLVVGWETYFRLSRLRSPSCLSQRDGHCKTDMSQLRESKAWTRQQNYGMSVRSLPLKSMFLRRSVLLVQSSPVVI